MKMIKWLLLITASVICFLSLSIAVSASDAIIPFDDFESYKDSIGGNWRAQGRYTKAPLATTEKGKSIMSESVPGGMIEIIQDFPETPVDKVNFGVMFSMKFDDFNARRSIYTRNAEGEYDIFKVEQNGKISVNDIETDEIIMQTDKWYSFYLEYNSDTGYIRLSINDGSDTAVITKHTAVKKRTGISRIDFVSSPPGEGVCVTYIDDVAFYVLDYTVEPYKPEPSNHLIPFFDFENFETGYNFPRNQTAMHLTEWTFQNDVKSLKVLQTEMGNSAYVEPAGWTGFMYGNSSWTVPDSLTLNFSVKPVKLGNFIRACMVYLNDNTRAFPFQINTDGTITVMSTTFPASTFKVETGYWYDVSIEYSIRGTAKVTISGNGNSAVLEASGGSLPNVTRLSILSGTGAAYYLDNVEMIRIESEYDVMPTATGVCAVSPATGYVDSGEIVLNLDGIVDESVLSDMYATINGDSEYIESIDIDDDKIVIRLSQDIPHDSVFFFEIGNILINGNKIGASTVLYTRKSFDIISFDAVTYGNATQSTLVIISDEDEPRNVTLLTVLYNDETGAMVAADFDECTIENSTAELNTEVIAPDNGSYTAVSYIWDNIKNMRSLNEKRVNK